MMTLHSKSCNTKILLHWGYELTKKDFDDYKKSK